MIKINLYSAKGIKKQKTNLPRSYQEKENLALLAQAIRVYESKKHPGLSKTKGRGEVSVSTRKIWRQKGTGRARHGARSAPIFVGGGVAHGPKGAKRKLGLPKKMRQKALKVALSIKAREGKIIFIDNTSVLKKTKEAATLLKKIGEKEEEIGKNTRFTFVLSKENSKAKLAIRNLKDTEVVFFENLNAYHVYFGGVLIIDRDVFKKTKKSKSSSKKSKTVAVKDKKGGKK